MTSYSSPLPQPRHIIGTKGLSRLGTQGVGSARVNSLTQLPTAHAHSHTTHTLIVVRLVSGLNNAIECTLGGLRKAFTQDPSENGMKTGLVLDPRSHSIVTNSTPGLLQFYDPYSSAVVEEVCALILTGCC